MFSLRVLVIDRQISTIIRIFSAVQDFSEVIGQTEAKKQLPKSLDGLSDLVSGAGQQNGGSTPVAGRSKTVRSILLCILFDNCG